MNTIREHDVSGNASDADETTHVNTLRETVVGELRGMRAVCGDRVAGAFCVPQHVFALGAPLDEVYTATTSVATKRDERGVAISSVSMSETEAFMLEQAEIRPNMNVLESGSGGYNTALMAEMVSSEGTVTPVDIDPEMTGRACSLLDAAVYSWVNVVLADTENGCSGAPPTTESSSQTRVGRPASVGGATRRCRTHGRSAGRRACPLAGAGGRGDYLVSRSAKVCSFVEIQGTEAYQERLLLSSGEEIGLRFDDARPKVVCIFRRHHREQGSLR